MTAPTCPRDPLVRRSMDRVQRDAGPWRPVASGRADRRGCRGRRNCETRPHILSHPDDQGERGNASRRSCRSRSISNTVAGGRDSEGGRGLAWLSSRRAGCSALGPVLPFARRAGSIAPPMGGFATSGPEDVAERLYYRPVGSHEIQHLVHVYGCLLVFVAVGSQAVGLPGRERLRWSPRRFTRPRLMACRSSV